MNSSSIRNSRGVFSSDNSTGVHHLIKQAHSFHMQFEHLGELKYLESAIEYQNKAMTLTPEGHPLRFMPLFDLGQSFMTQFKHYGNPEDIEKATVYSSQAVNTAPQHLLATTLRVLGTVHDYRFSAFHQLEDIERSLSFKLQALCSGHPGAEYMPGIYNELGISLLSRFQHLNDPQDVDHAIMCQEQSLIGTHQHGEYSKWMMNLGATLRDRFMHLGREEDINSSIVYLHRAAGLITTNQIALKSMCVNNLASALASRFDHYGKLVDLDECILIMKQTIPHGPGGYPEKGRSLSNLGFYLEVRFQRLGDLNDINQAIECQEQSVSMSRINGDFHPEWHNNLGNSLMARFTRLREPRDLDEAIRHMETVARTTATNDRLRYSALNNLGNFLSLRFQDKGNVEDIDASIKYLSEAIIYTHGNDAYRATWFRNLGGSYMIRFLHSSQTDDLNHTIKYLNEALSLIPEQHLERSEILNLLGKAYIHGFERFRRPLDYILGIRVFHEAALLPSGLPKWRLDAVVLCARYSMSIDKAFALKHYEMAMNLLPSIVWLGTTVRRRYNDLTSIGGMVTEAAAAAIEFQQYETAVEWLEQGRSIVWQQALNLRAPFDDLGQVKPALANRLREVARQLEFVGTTRPTSAADSNNTPISEQTAQTHRRLAEDWDRTLEEARRIPGFKSFMRPQKAEELVRAAQSGSVVIVNVDVIRCDALALRSNSKSVTHISLPNFSHLKAAAAYRQLTHSLQRKGVRERGIHVGQGKQADMFESILSLLWTDIVQPILASLGYTVCLCSYILISYHLTL